jgi:6-pyruvoyltetrahydropterin/6-carboxytetrahydropterin synthase
MYTAIVEAGFHAAHHVRLPDGTWETPHEHDWRVRAHFCRAELDDAEMVVDFCRAQSELEAILARLDHQDLNRFAGLSGRSPTAEVVARYLCDALRARGFDEVRRVEVREAPGCVAAYERPS